MDINEYIKEVINFPEFTMGSSLRELSLATQLLKELPKDDFADDFIDNLKRIFKNKKDKEKFLHNFRNICLCSQRYFLKNSEERLSILNDIGIKDNSNFIDEVSYYKFLKLFLELFYVKDLISIEFEFLIFHEEFVGVDLLMDGIYKKTDEMETKIEDSNINLVTILGIFTAMIFALFGGINLIIPSLNDLLQVPIIKLSLFMLIIGFILYNIIMVIFKMLIDILKIKVSLKYANNSIINVANIVFMILIIILIVVNIVLN